MLKKLFKNILDITKAKFPSYTSKTEQKQIDTEK